MRLRGSSGSCGFWGSSCSLLSDWLCHRHVTRFWPVVSRGNLPGPSVWRKDLTGEHNEKQFLSFLSDVVICRPHRHCSSRFTAMRRLRCGRAGSGEQSRKTEGVPATEMAGLLHEAALAWPPGLHERILKKTKTKQNFIFPEQV